MTFWMLSRKESKQKLNVPRKSNRAQNRIAINKDNDLRESKQKKKKNIRQMIWLDVCPYAHSWRDTMFSLWYGFRNGNGAPKWPESIAKRMHRLSHCNGCPNSNSRKKEINETEIKSPVICSIKHQTRMSSRVERMGVWFDRNYRSVQHNNYAHRQFFSFLFHIRFALLEMCDSKVKLYK